MSKQFKELIESILRDDLIGASCAQLTPKLFDSQRENEKKEKYQARLERAAKVCHRCPVIRACEDTAAALPPAQQHGIWAGRDMTTTQAKQWARLRKKQHHDQAA